MNKKKFIPYDFFKLAVAVILILILLLALTMCSYEPIIPTLNLPSETLYEGMYALSGDGSPEAPLGVILNDEIVSKFNSDEIGAWQTEVELSAGNNDLQIVEFNKKGEIIAESMDYRFPALPTPITPTFELPSKPVTEGNVAISGVGSPNGTMGLLVNGEIVSEFMSDADGNWKTDVELAVGENSTQVVEFDVNGNIIAESETYLFPVIPQPKVPTLMLPSVNPTEGTIELSGEGSPNASMGLLVNSELMSEFTTDENGQWKTIVAIDAGEYALQIVEFDTEGEIVVSSEDYSMSIDNKVIEPSISVASDNLMEGANQFSGVSSPNATMGLLVNGELVSKFMSDADGNWQTEVELSAGDNDVQIVQFDADGNIIAESEIYTMTAEALVPIVVSDDVVEPPNGWIQDLSKCGVGKIKGAYYIVNYCENLSRIAKALGVEKEDILMMNPEIADPNLIYPGQRLLIP